MQEPLNWESIADRRPEVPRHVVHRDFASESVLLNVETGHYYGMDEVGARFFAVLGESPNVRSAVSALSQEFEAPAERIRDDMVKFCGELVALGLLELTRPDERAGSARLRRQGA